LPDVTTGSRAFLSDGNSQPRHEICVAHRDPALRQLPDAVGFVLAWQVSDDPSNLIRHETDTRAWAGTMIALHGSDHVSQRGASLDKAPICAANQAPHLGTIGVQIGGDARDRAAGLVAVSS
jgi:hypothetical protein